MTSLEITKQAVAEHIGAGDYQPDQTFLSLGIDSLDFLEILMIVEDETDTNLDEERFSLTMTLGQFAEVLNEFLQ